MADYTKAELVKEKLRRQNEEQLRFYKPHSAQNDFHKSEAKVRGVITGNQWGKTYGGCMDLAWATTKTHPHRKIFDPRTGKEHLGAVFARDCCISLKLIRQVLIPTYKKILPRKPCIINGKKYCGLRGGSWKNAWSEKDNALHFEDGSFIEFMSYEQGREAFQGSQRHYIRHDEEPPEDIYNENKARQITCGINMVFTLTPLNYSQWLYMELAEKSITDPNVDLFTGSTSENPYADQEVLKDIENNINSEAEREARLHGKFVYISGRILKYYGNHNYIDYKELPREWERIVSIDPHPEKPTHVTWTCIDPFTNIPYVYRELQISENVEDICREIGLLSHGEKITFFVIDPSSRASAKIRGQGSLIDEFKKHIPIIFEANNHVKDKTQDLLAGLVKDSPTGASFFVMKNCPVTHHQLLNYSWKPPLKSGEDRAKPQVFKKGEDFCDCVLQTLQMMDFQDGVEAGDFNATVYGNKGASMSITPDKEDFSIRMLG